MYSGKIKTKPKEKQHPLRGRVHVITQLKSRETSSSVYLCWAWKLRFMTATDVFDWRYLYVWIWYTEILNLHVKISLSSFFEVITSLEPLGTYEMALRSSNSRHRHAVIHTYYVRKYFLNFLIYLRTSNIFDN